MSNRNILVGLALGAYGNLYSGNAVEQAMIHLAQIDDRAKLYNSNATAKGAIVGLAGLYRLSKFFKDKGLHLSQQESNALHNRIFYSLPARKLGMGAEFSEHAYHIEAHQHYANWLADVESLGEDLHAELILVLGIVVHELKTLIAGQIEYDARRATLASAVSTIGPVSEQSTPTKPVQENLNEELAIREDLMKRHHLDPNDPLAAAFEDALGVFSEEELWVVNNPAALQAASLERRDIIRLASLRRNTSVDPSSASAIVFKAEQEALEAALGVGLNWVKENAGEAPGALNEDLQKPIPEEVPALPANHWFVSRVLTVPVDGQEGVTRDIDLMHPEGEDAMNPVVNAMRLVIHHVGRESHMVHSVDNLVDGLMSLGVLNTGIKDMTAALLEKTGLGGDAAPLSTVFDPKKFYPMDPMHWLYTEKDNAPPMMLLSPNDLLGRTELAKAVLAGVKWALSVGTQGGTLDVFDPDRIAQQSVTAILGYATPTGLPVHGPYKDLDRKPFDWASILVGFIRNNQQVSTGIATKPAAKKPATKRAPVQVELSKMATKWLEKNGLKAVTTATLGKLQPVAIEAPKYVQRALEAMQATLVKA